MTMLKKLCFSFEPPNYRGSAGMNDATAGDSNADSKTTAYFLTLSIKKT